LATEFHARIDWTNIRAAFAGAAAVGVVASLIAAAYFLGDDRGSMVVSLSVGGFLAVLLVAIGSVLACRRVLNLTIAVDDEAMTLLHEGRSLGRIPFANVEKILPARPDYNDIESHYVSLRYFIPWGWGVGEMLRYLPNRSLAGFSPESFEPIGIHVVLRRADDPATDWPASISHDRRITITGGWDRTWLAMVDLLREHELRHLAAHGQLSEPAAEDEPFRFT
jgi:hypothetical protein